jgi:hypothetical protein
MKVAKAKGRLRGKKPKLNQRQETHLVAYSTAANTAPLSSQTCSASPAPLSTGLWSESELATSWASTLRSADGSLVVSRGPPLRDSTALPLSESLGPRS